jgi:hypothetical protein
VRTPLNAIINYLEIALEGTLDKETRENLAKSHSASKSLIYVINDLLDLTKTEEGQELIKDEILDLPACIAEATEAFKVDAKRKGISYEVLEHPGLPKYVHGDYRRVRQVVANVTANAMQHTTKGSVKVESYVVEVQECRVRLEIAVHDTGCGMSNEKLDNLFQDLEQVSADLDESESLDASLDETRDGRTLGLGLAIVARIVRNMDGQLRLTSNEGVGSRFVIQLPFELPTGEALEKLGASDATIKSTSDSTISASVTKTLPPPEAGEVLLVDRGSAHALNSSSRSIAETRSFDETNSVNSRRSGGSTSARSTKSDAHRLIDAIQHPSSTDELDVEATTLQRKLSRRRHYANNSTSSMPNLDVLHQAAVHTGVSERPSLPRRSSAGPIKPPDTQSGVHFVQDSGTPIKPVKIPDDYLDPPTEPQTAQSSRILFEIPEKPGQGKDVTKSSASSHLQPKKLRVLIAEDDPVNMKILTKRLEKAGHEVCPTLNGEDCASKYKEKSAEFDIVLMDMQVCSIIPSDQNSGVAGELEGELILISDAYC